MLKRTRHFEYSLQQSFACACVVLTAIVSHILHFRSHYLGSHSLTEWAPFFLIGGMLPVICYASFRLLQKKLPYHSLIFCMVLTAFGCLAIIAEKALMQLNPHSMITLFWISGFILITSGLLAKKYLVEQNYVSYVVSGLGTLAMWCALFQLPNWQMYLTAFKQAPLFTGSISAVIWLIVQKFVLANPSDRVPFTPTSWQKRLFLFAFILFACIVSFRSDRLFRDGSYAFHWAYYVGPIATLRIHGWLLWDTPSQYGFLNLVLASLLPTKSAWTAMYVFQSLLLTVASLFFYQISATNKNLFRWGIGLCIGLCALHFADPTLQGPAPYPSSSVMRFFWCYGLLWIVYQYWQERLTLKTLAMYGSLGWSLSMLWSAESAIYGTCIFFPALVIAWLQTVVPVTKGHWQALILNKKSFYLLFPFLLLSCFMLSISGYYRIFLGHYPEWSSHFLYGLLYAGGFGAYPLNPNGAVWILILLLAGLMTITVTTIKENIMNRSIVLLVSLIGCLWSISSYFVGRAVPNNITAILPLLVGIIFITLQINERQKMHNTTLLLPAFAAPVLFIALFTVFGNPSLSAHLRAFRSVSVHISQHVPQADFPEELATLMQQAHINEHTPIAYNGNMGLLPYLHDGRSYEQLWLPNPLQLLESPVPPERQKLIIQRFLEGREFKWGYLIHPKKETTLPFSNWKTTLSHHVTQTAVFESKHWMILRYEPIMVR
jgi:hypothetical protein